MVVPAWKLSPSLFLFSNRCLHDFLKSRKQNNNMHSSGTSQQADAFKHLLLLSELLGIISYYNWSYSQRLLIFIGFHPASLLITLDWKHSMSCRIWCSYSWQCCLLFTAKSRAACFLWSLISFHDNWILYLWCQTHTPELVIRQRFRFWHVCWFKCFHYLRTPEADKQAVA